MVRKTSNALGALIVIALSTFGCSSSRDREAQRILDSPISYQSHLSPWANMTEYKTWNWVPVPANAPVDPRARDPQLRGEIEKKIEAHMKLRGYTGPRSSPDVFVNYHVSTRTIGQDDIKNMYDGKYLPQYRMEFEGPAQAGWKEGSLLILIFDARAERMVWHSSATAEIIDEAPEARSIARLDEAIKMMFTSLPGKPAWETNR